MVHLAKKNEPEIYGLLAEQRSISFSDSSTIRNMKRLPYT